MLSSVFTAAGYEVPVSFCAIKQPIQSGAQALGRLQRCLIDQEERCLPGPVKAGWLWPVSASKDRTGPNTRSYHLDRTGPDPTPGATIWTGPRTRSYHLDRTVLSESACVCVCVCMCVHMCVCVCVSVL